MALASAGVMSFSASNPDNCANFSKHCSVLGISPRDGRSPRPRERPRRGAASGRGGSPGRRFPFPSSWSPACLTSSPSPPRFAIRSPFNPPAIDSVCRRRISIPFELYNGRESGLGVRLPNWRYPVVCDTATGRLAFDNFGGRSGQQAQLDAFLQSYAVEKAKLEARRRGHSVVEQSLADGSIKLTVQVVGGAA